MTGELKFKSLVNRLLTETKDVAKITPVVSEMAEILSRWTGVSVEDDLNNWDSVYLKTGVAISPVQAARCLKEPVRSQVFLKGVYQAIKDGLREKETVSLLYAGTGPFGTIVLPLLPLFKSEQVQVTCLDIHQDNVDAIKKLTSAMGIEPWIREIQVADATQWRPEKDNEKFDIIVSETMNTFLRREPQVTIFANLQQYLSEGGTLIPQSVTTSIWIPEVSNHENQNDTYKANRVCELFELSIASARAIHRGDLSSLKTEFRLPGDIQGFVTCLQERTFIQVYKNNCLDINESSLCIPMSRSQFAGVAGDTVSYQYVIKQEPDWEIGLPDYFADKCLPDYDLKSDFGLCYFPYIWDKYRRIPTKHFDKQKQPTEQCLENKFLDLFEINLFELMSFLANGFPTLNQFEHWFFKHARDYSEAKMTEFNLFVKNTIY